MDNQSQLRTFSKRPQRFFYGQIAQEEDKKMSGSKVEGRRLNGGGELSPRSLSLRLLHTLALTEGEERRGPTQTRTIALIDLRDLSPDPTSPSSATSE
ncbi:hypothetical protein Aduo_008207 [Ancylostoma duodenale]